MQRTGSILPAMCVVNSVFSFLYIDMNYHIGHHMFPMAPCLVCPAAVAGGRRAGGVAARRGGGIEF